MKQQNRTLTRYLGSTLVSGVVSQVKSQVMACSQEVMATPEQVSKRLILWVARGNPLSLVVSKETTSELLLRE